MVFNYLFNNLISLSYVVNLINADTINSTIGIDSSLRHFRLEMTKPERTL